MKIQIRSNVIDSVTFVIATIGSIMGVYCVYGLYTNCPVRHGYTISDSLWLRGIVCI